MKAKPKAMPAKGAKALPAFMQPKAGAAKKPAGKPMPFKAGGPVKKGC